MTWSLGLCHYNRFHVYCKTVSGNISCKKQESIACISWSKKGVLGVWAMKNLKIGEWIIQLGQVMYYNLSSKEHTENCFSIALVWM